MNIQTLSRKRILFQTGPLVLSQAAIATTGVVDTVVIGLFEDKVALAAVAIASVTFSFIYWSFGFLRMSTTGLVAQAIGAEDIPEAKAVFLRALLLGLIFGVGFVVLFPILSWLALELFVADIDVEILAQEYFSTRIWGAPALLMSFGISGWLIGRGQTGKLLLFQIILNGVNVLLDGIFVAILDWGPAGIGAGTAITEWVALLIGLLFVRDTFRGFGRLFDGKKLKFLLAVDRDIFFRTVALVSCIFWFTRAGTTMDTATVAGNEVLLQFIAVSAFVLDSFAFVLEKEAGEAFGRNDRRMLLRSIRLTTELAIMFALVISLLYMFIGTIVIQTIISDPDAKSIAKAYLPFCAVIPIVGVAAWQLDGLFLGVTKGRVLRNAGIAAALLYLCTDLVLRPTFGNAGLWWAFIMMYVYRAVCLGYYVPSLFKGEGKTSFTDR